MPRNAILKVYILVNFAVAAIGLALFVGGQVLVNGQGLELLKAVGTSVAAAGFTGLLLTTYVELQDRRDSRIQTLADEASVLGLTQAHERRPKMVLSERPFRNAREIDILEISGRTISDKYEEVDAWRHSCPKARVRVILLHPAFPTPSESFAGRRDAEENRPPGEISHEVQRFFELYGARHKWGSGKHSGSYELRLSRTMPTVAFVRADRVAYMAPYLAHLTGPDVPHVQIGEGTLMRALEEHFEKLWLQAVVADQVLTPSESAQKPGTATPSPPVTPAGPIDASRPSASEN